ncbi:MAG: DUF6295 family protein [Hyphomicrobiales bacterium]
MCTNIVVHAEISGSGKGAEGWFSVNRAHVSYDHPYHARLEHAVNIDLVDDEGGLGARVAAELSLEGARNLARAIMAAVAEAEAWERGEVAVPGSVE